MSKIKKMWTESIVGLVPVDDPFFRYKIPSLELKYEGKKTVLSNIHDLGVALNRDPQNIGKYFGYELAVHVHASERIAVSGIHDQSLLQSLLSQVVEHYVICAVCRDPGTKYKIKSNNVFLVCSACGSRSLLDDRHKLTNLIKKSGGRKKKPLEKKRLHTPDIGIHYSERDCRTEEAARGENCSENALLWIDDDADEAAAEGAHRFRIFLETCKEESTTPTPAAIVEQLRVIQTTQSLRPADRIIIYLGATFTDNAATEKAVEQHAEVLKALATSVIQQRHLIAAVEWLCGARHPEKLKRYFPILLQQMFEEDLVEEDTFFAWAADLDRNDYSAHQSMIDLDTLEELKKIASPFITWLQEAEEEGEDEEEDEEEEEA